MRKMKKIKLNEPVENYIGAVQNFVLEISNAKLVSIPLQFHIKRFLRGLEKIDLSDELQDVCQCKQCRQGR